MKEADVQKACLDYLRAKGIFCWKNHSGGIYDPKRGVFRTIGTKGVSDILGIIPKKTQNGLVGRFLACEVKMPKGKTTEAQEAFLEEIDRNGGLAMIVHSVEELEQFLEGEL